MNDKYHWKDEHALLSSLVKACRLVNDKVRTRLPIHCSLLEMILFEVEWLFHKQWYLENMYKALFALGYYGRFRVGELTRSEHVIKACDVHLGANKHKILVALYSSKTHDKTMKPQKVKITANVAEKSGKYANRYFCPFTLIRNYVSLRGPYDTFNECFLVF